MYSSNNLKDKDMTNTTIVFLFLAFVCLVSSSLLDPAEFEECGLWDNLIMRHRCLPLVSDFMENYEQKKDTDPERKISLEKATTCLEGRKCKDASLMKLSLEDLMDTKHNPNNDQKRCLQNFFVNVYDAHESNDRSSCLGSFSFLDNDTDKKREAYKLGKSCFMEHVNNKCKPAAAEYFINKYQILTNVLTEEQVEGVCSRLYDHLNLIYCTALTEKLSSQRMVNFLFKKESSPSDKAKTMQLCKAIKISYMKACDSPKDSLDNFEERCANTQ